MTSLQGPAPDEFCSTRDAAQMLGVSIKTVQLWSETGALQAWKTPGGHRRITLKSVNALLLQRRQVAAAPLNTNAKEAAARRWNVLVVEDEPELRRLYELTLSHWGLPFNLRTAPNGFEALVGIGELKPDVLITDLRLPGMDGLRMLESLRNYANYQSIRVIVVSGLSTAEIRAHGGLPEEIPVLSKPIPFDRLRILVESHLLRP